MEQPHPTNGVPRCKLGDTTHYEEEMPRYNSIVFESHRARRMAAITCDLLVKEYDITKEACWKLLRDEYSKSFTQNTNPVIQVDVIAASEGLTRRPDVRR